MTVLQAARTQAAAGYAWFSPWVVCLRWSLLVWGQHESDEHHGEDDQVHDGAAGPRATLDRHEGQNGLAPDVFHDQQREHQRDQSNSEPTACAAAAG